VYSSLATASPSEFCVKDSLTDGLGGELVRLELATPSVIDRAVTTTRPSILAIVTRAKNRTPDRQTLLLFGLAAMKNARDLLEDAQILLEAGRWARAYAIAVLSSEEFGKAGVAMRLWSLRSAELEQVVVRRLTGDHRVKLEAAYQHEGFLAEGEQWLDKVLGAPAEARHENLDKQRALYVDYRTTARSSSHQTLPKTKRDSM
jgi:AbiV family abortive infection protein